MRGAAKIKTAMSAIRENIFVLKPLLPPGHSHQFKNKFRTQNSQHRARQKIVMRENVRTKNQRSPSKMNLTNRVCVTLYSRMSIALHTA
jgi:hypothetical protein